MLGTTEKMSESLYKHKIPIRANISNIKHTDKNTRIIIFRPQSHTSMHFKATFREHAENEKQLFIPNFFCQKKKRIQNSICKNMGFILKKGLKYKANTEKHKRSKN